MIIIFEIDKTIRNGRIWNWKPFLFKGLWESKKTWRFCWGIFSISVYPSKSLRSFFGEATGNKFWHGENIIYQNVKNIIERKKNVRTSKFYCCKRGW